MKKENIEFWKTSRDGLQRAALLIGTTLVISLMMSALLYSFLAPHHYELGQIAATSIRAPRDFLVEDEAGTKRRRAEAARKVKEVFTLLDESKVVTYKIDTLFETLRRYQKAAEQLLNLSETDKHDIGQTLDVDLSEPQWEILRESSRWPQIEGTLIELIRPILDRGIVADKGTLRQALQKNGAVLMRKSDGDERVLTGIQDLYNSREATEALQTALSANSFGYGEEFDSLITILVTKYLKLKPTVFYDSQTTQDRLDDAQRSVEPIYFKIRQGELIVRAGDRISESQLAKLSRLHELYASTNLLRTFLGYFLIILVTLGVAYAFCTISWWEFAPTNRDLLLVCLTLLGGFALVHFYSILSMALSLYFPSLGPDFFIFATPFATGGILLQVTLGTAGLLMFLLPFAIFTALFFNNSITLLVIIILGNIVGAMSLKHCSTRGAFIRAGIRIAALNMCIVVPDLLGSPRASAAENLAPLFAAVLGGLTSGVLGAGLAPISEYLGRYITDIKLLELASLDQPLLRELSLQAPGTWNHSMVIGQMGEVAAKSISANGLLTRVGAYYHDVGKTRKPAYFIENQGGDHNRHDKLEPSMSALIVRAHVKDGVELAREYRLPNAIIDFIPQHHGTALMEFFYEKALRDAEDDEVVEENHYRYPGPKPQTKEAGILMLADGIEASSRTLVDPTPAKINGLVQKQINRVFASGQLDECELTLKDLHEIAKSFTKVLTGIYHRRIEYSEPAEKVREGKFPKAIESGEGAEKVATKSEEKKTSGRPNGKANGGDHGKDTSAEKGSNGEHKDTLKRLGM